MLDQELRIRWMIVRDLPDVLRIEKASFASPWTEDDYRRTLSRRDCIGQVAERGDTLLGYMVYRLYRHRFGLLNLAVDPQHRRQGIGAALIAKLARKLSSGGRHKLTIQTGERNLGAHLFLRSQGFKAVGVKRRYFKEPDEDAILFELNVPEGAVMAEFVEGAY